jgi:hypothetical protein
LAFSTPEKLEALAVPGDEGFRRHDHHFKAPRTPEFPDFLENL